MSRSLTSLLLLLSGCAPYTSPVYLIEDGLDKLGVSNELSAGMYFYAEHQGVEYEFVSDGLVIKVVADVIQGKYSGLYFPGKQLLIVHWKGSNVGDTAFFHELHHRYLYLTTGVGDYQELGIGRHTERFLEEARTIRKMWNKDFSVFSSPAE